MHLTRSFEIFSFLSKRKLQPYGIIHCEREPEPNRRIRTERLYDEKTSSFLYSNFKDYDEDTELPSNLKYIITNDIDHYLQKRNDVLIRYIPLFTPKMKQYNIKKIEEENELLNENIVKLYETTIAYKVMQWDKLLENKNIEGIKQCLNAEIYSVISNQFPSVATKEKRLKELLPSFIKTYQKKYILSAQNNLITYVPDSSHFSIKPLAPYYMNYNYVVNWFWFRNEIGNTMFETFSYIYDLDIIDLDFNLRKLQVPVNSTQTSLIVRSFSISTQLLHNFEVDYLSDKETKEDCLAYIKNCILRGGL